ncbi:MAG TPA: DUF3685 domain-containing protein [Coleofasciculaceae cyanobacterium]
MSDSAAKRDRVPQLIYILLIDDDPIFRLGLRTAVESLSDLQVVAEADTAAAAFDRLETHRDTSINLVILELGLGRDHRNQLSGLPLCQHLKAEYPNLPILLLTAESNPLLLSQVQNSGIEGYCPKGCESARIVQAIRQVAAGQSYWPALPNPALQPSVDPPTWHHQLRSSGLQQIDEALAVVTRQLQQPNLSTLDWFFWTGRRRELVAARWVVNQLLPSDVIVVERSSEIEIGTGQGGNRRIQEYAPARVSTSPLSKSSLSPIHNQLGVLANSAPSTASLSLLPHQSTPLELTLTKLQSGLSNLTGVVLEIDILAEAKRRDLIYIILQKFEEILNDLRFSQVRPEQLSQKRSRLLLDLWQVSLTEFFGKYYTLPIEQQDFEVVKVLLSNAAIVQLSILERIPFVVELLSHQLFEAPLMIDNVPYSAQTPEAIERAELLLQNLILQIANAVIQPLLNEFADIEIIKQTFYDRRLISSREIARFRNNLSWKYRLSQFLNEPRAIFESRYDLLVLTDTGIKQTSIYAPRRQELEKLRGIQLVVTLAYEARDAIAPRLRGTIAWAGRGIVYVLTQVLGRSIGLIVRGVIQGIGSTLQDVRYGKNGERGK